MIVIGHTEEHEEVIPQEVTLGWRRPKWLQETLKEAKDVGELERIMQRSKDPEIFCIYLATVTSITDSELHSSC